MNRTEHEQNIKIRTFSIMIDNRMIKVRLYNLTTNYLIYLDYTKKTHTYNIYDKKPRNCPKRSLIMQVCQLLYELYLSAIVIYFYTIKLILLFMPFFYSSNLLRAPDTRSIFPCEVRIRY